MSDRQILLICILCLSLITGCGEIPRVTAEERMFPHISLEFLGEYILPKTDYQNTKVGGLSGIAYDRQSGKFLAISDDRSQFAPARFYTLNLKLSPQGIDKVEIEKVTFLTDQEGKNYSKGSIDPEGIAISPRQTVFISSEGVPSINIAPFVQEYDLTTGKYKESLPIPQRYLPSNNPPQGVQENLGFEALTLNPNSLAAQDPFRLFTATESALLQDTTPDQPDISARLRFLHYVINPIGNPLLVAEHLYLLDTASSDTLSNGLSELTALEKEGYFLSLERTFGLTGAGAKIFQVVVANATDTSNIPSFRENISKITPLQKQLLLDLNQLGIELDNLEAMTLGPRLSDGSKTLVLVSDDNFNDSQVTQFLLFRLVEK